MKNLPSKRASRDSRAREHTRQFRSISRNEIHDSRSRKRIWTFSDHTLAHGKSECDVRKRPGHGGRSPQTSNLYRTPEIFSGPLCSARIGEESNTKRLILRRCSMKRFWKILSAVGLAF